MPSERIRRRVEGFFEEADEAATRQDWSRVAAAARAVLAIDEANEDALAFLAMAVANDAGGSRDPAAVPDIHVPPGPRPAAEPTAQDSFVGGRYRVRRFLGEGGKKRVFLAHDEALDRDVAFAVIKDEGLDAAGRERIRREAQAMGRLTHPNVVSIFDIGEEGGAPYVVTELMRGGDVEGLIEREGGPLPVERTLRIAVDVCRGLAFAHEHGIVHRDLKPGNVWLTEDGTAKIGDFGLAVSMDRSRLTQHGMMVGTVAYMPPEQALGSEVTPRADLYALGAMLYELVTGRPPFAGDSPTAVISQHINTAPVAPSWHAANCPADLEDLILGLLEKDPLKRPASADEVARALDRVDPAQPPRLHSGSATNPLDRLARGVFVGREREIARLFAAFDDAFGGRGSLVMLVGEPGVGKTRTAQQLAMYARTRGAHVCWGRAREAADAPPYLPWAEIARAYAERVPEHERREAYRPYAADLHRIFQDVRDLLPEVARGQPNDDEGQFRLFDALASFLRSAAAAKPLLLVLDDLHWADPASLQMLTHVARELGHARVLIVGTYRDTDLDRGHPLAAALAELSREPSFSRISLHGLSRDEVGDYLRAAAQIDPSSRLVERVYTRTEGNAFFLTEVVNLLVQEGSLDGASQSDAVLPDGVKEALYRRLARLSPEASELLSMAALVGREFAHVELAAVSGRTHEELLGFAEEALAGRLIEETDVPGTYRFGHALMQETLLGELSRARRIVLHGQIAEALEAFYGPDAALHSSELSGHYAESATFKREHAHRAAHYLRVAAEQAESALAYDSAIESYERCLELVGSAPDGLGYDEAALYTQLAGCSFHARDSLRGWRALTRAVQLHESLGNSTAMAAAVNGTLEANVAPPEISEHVALVDRTLGRLGPGPSVDVCRLLAIRSWADFGDEGASYAKRAEEMARQLALPRREWPARLRSRELLATLEDGRFRDVLSRSAEPDHDNAFSLTVACFSAVFSGEIIVFRDRLDAFVAHHGLRSSPRMVRDLEVISARAYWRSGEVERANELIAHAPESSFYLAVLRAEMALEARQPERALELLPPTDHPATGNPTLRAVLAGLRARALQLLGRLPLAKTSFAEWLTAYVDGPFVLTRAAALGAIDDALCALAERSFLAEIRQYLAGDLRELRSWYIGTSPYYLRGAVALRLDLVDEAAEHFRNGLDWAERQEVRFNVDIGRCHQGLAEAAQRLGDLERSSEHLDAAGEAFSRSGAQLYLDQILNKKEILNA